MVTKKQNRVRHTNKVKGLSEAFEEIEAHFTLLGFSSDDSQTAEEAPGAVSDNDADEDEPENEEGDFDDGDASYETSVYDREDLEVTLDVFISELVSNGVIRKTGPAERPPSIGAVFEEIFGENHEIVTLIKNFDRNVKGYFGAISREDMDEAFSELLAIRAIIDKEAGVNSEN